jgi:hypothetical protein
MPNYKIKILKKGLFAALFSLLLIPGIATPCLAQGEPTVVTSPEQKKKAAAEAETSALMETMVAHALKGNYVAFARHLVYDGSDPVRKLLTLVNYDSPFERLDTENQANRLSKSLKGSQMHNLSNFRIMQWSGRDMGVWDFDVTRKNGKIKKHKITFLQIKGKYEYVRIE